MIAIKKSILLSAFSLLMVSGFAQFAKNQRAFGGEFLVFNTTNDFSQTERGFSKNTGAGLSISFNKGKFVKQNLYAFGIFSIGYNAGNRRTEDNDALGLNLERTRYSNSSIGIGAGLRKYYPATEKIGLYLHGQIVANVTNVKSKFFASKHDTVLSNVTQSYPIYNAGISIVPGVYVQLNPKWQLNFNIGNLYLSHSWVPERKGVVERRNTSSLGMNFNIFDFRLGVLYMPGRVKKPE